MFSLRSDTHFVARAILAHGQVIDNRFAFAFNCDYGHGIIRRLSGKTSQTQSEFILLEFGRFARSQESRRVDFRLETAHGNHGWSLIEAKPLLSGSITGPVVNVEVNRVAFACVT